VSGAIGRLLDRGDIVGRHTSGFEEPAQIVGDRFICPELEACIDERLLESSRFVDHSLGDDVPLAGRVR
jgi:hypothetical protein